MSDLVGRLRKWSVFGYGYEASCDMKEAATAIEAQSANMANAARLLSEQTDRIEQLEAALRECEAELDAYYRNEYGGIHPYNQKKLEQAMATNPARAALENVHSIGHEDGLCPRERT